MKKLLRILCVAMVCLVSHTLKASDTPTWNTLGSSLYLVGSVTSWSASDDYQIYETESGSQIYQGTFSYESGYVDGFCFFINKDYGWRTSNVVRVASQPITIGYNGKATVDMISDSSGSNIIVEDFTSGEMTITVDFNTNLLTVDLGTAKNYLVLMGLSDVEPTPANMSSYEDYVMVEGATGIYSGSFDIPAGEFSLYLSPAFTEDGWNSTAYYAGTEDVDMLNKTDKFGSVTYGLVEATSGGKWTVSNWAGGTVNVKVNLNDNTVKFTIPEFAGNFVYLFGNDTGYLEPSESNRATYEAWALPETYAGSNVYQQVFNLPAGEKYIRFYTALSGWSGGDAIGSQISDSTTTIEFDGNTTVALVEGQGMWNFYWEGGEIKITVDLNSSYPCVNFNSNNTTLDYTDIITQNGISYKISEEAENEVYVYSIGLSGDVVIPSSITVDGTEYSVTSFGDYAFSTSNCADITSITIPSTIESTYLSYFNNLTSLTALIVGEDHPNYCSIDGVLFSKDKTQLLYCPNGKTGEYSIPSHVLTIGSNSFYNCSGLTAIEIPNSVTTIEGVAFMSCTGITSINIPNSVTTIGGNAFGWCSGLTSIEIPASVTSIGGNLIQGCTSLESIVVDANNTVYDSRENCNAIIETSTNKLISGCNNSEIPNTIITIGNSAFSACHGLTAIEIPNSVTTIEVGAFNYCTGLTSVVIPNSVTTIGDNAFRDCHNMTSLVISKSITSIEHHTFYGCRSLTSLEIPASVTSLGAEALGVCQALESITSYATVPASADYDPFWGVNTSKTKLYVPAGCTDAYAAAEYWSKFTNIYEMADVVVETEDDNATFEIPTTAGATIYTVNVYADAALTEIIATAQYDATGKIIPMSTSLELSIAGLEDGTYYYTVTATTSAEEELISYQGTFTILTPSEVEDVAVDNEAVEVARYDLTGRLLSEPAVGVNIVVMSDGTTRKEIVK